MTGQSLLLTVVVLLTYFVVTLASSSTMTAAHCVDHKESVQDDCWLCGTHCWHACASVWIPTSFRLRPDMHKHANTWGSLQLPALCTIHTASHRPALA
jgi:hypothetical protein